MPTSRNSKGHTTATTPKNSTKMNLRSQKALATPSPSKPSPPKSSSSRPSSSKSKTQQSSSKRKRDKDSPDETPSSPSDNKKRKQGQEEKRLKPFRNHAPQTFLQKLSRAQTQRMIVIGRKRLGEDLELREIVDVVGSTGNIYNVTIGRLPECTCPDHLKGNECKHKVYTLHTVLKAPEHLQYQRALLSSELAEIFSKAPPIPSEVGKNEDKDGRRKPIEGECPICYMDFEEDKNELVWCKASCGNNMHKSCFDKWVASQRGHAVRCVYCRADWELEKGDFKDIKQAGAVNEEGYVNVAEQFGMSQDRDWSSYHQPWVRRQFGYGW